MKHHASGMSLPLERKVRSCQFPVDRFKKDLVFPKPELPKPSGRGELGEQRTRRRYIPFLFARPSAGELGTNHDFCLQTYEYDHDPVLMRTGIGDENALNALNFIMTEIHSFQYLRFLRIAIAVTVKSDSAPVLLHKYENPKTSIFHSLARILSRLFALSKPKLVRTQGNPILSTSRYSSAIFPSTTTFLAPISQMLILSNLTFSIQT